MTATQYTDTPETSRLWRARAYVTQLVRRLSRDEWLLIGIVLLAYVYVISPANTNSLSRYDMVDALAHGTAIIDAHASNTIDVSFYHGHYYSPRSIGLSLVAVPVLWALHAIEVITHTHPTLTEQIGYLNIFTVVPASILGVIAFERLLLYLRPGWRGTRWPLVTTAAFALGTLFYPFSSVFFSHAFGGGLVFAGFYLIIRARTATREQRDRYIIIAGLLVGLGIIAEYPTALIMVVLMLYIWFTYGDERIRTVVLFAAGMAPWALVLGWYNWFAFGSPLHMSYDYVAGTQFQGQHKGLFGVTWPHPGAAWEIVAFPRGLIVESPFLLLIPLGLYRWFRSGYMRAEALAVTAITVIYIAFVSSYFLPMAGQNLPGPRLLVPMLPFACLTLAWVLDDARAWLRAIIALTVAFGIVISTIWVVLGVREYHTYLTYPVTDLFLPVLKTGYVPAKNGPTPPNFGTLLLKLPQGPSVWLMLAGMALFVGWCAWSIFRGNQLPASLHSAASGDEVSPEPAAQAQLP